MRTFVFLRLHINRDGAGNQDTLDNQLNLRGNMQQIQYVVDESQDN